MSGPTMSTRWIGWMRLVLDLSLVAGAAACAPGTESREPAEDSSTRTTQTRGEPASSQRASPSAEERRGDDEVLGRIPDLAVQDLSGRERRLLALVDGPTVVNFWATWCGPCKREMPELGELHRVLVERGAGGVVGIALDSGDPAKIREFAERHGGDYPQLQATRRWADRHFQLFGMPTTLVVDGRGRIHARLVGPQTRESVMRALEPLL